MRSSGDLKRHELYLRAVVMELCCFFLFHLFCVFALHKTLYVGQTLAQRRDDIALCVSLFLFHKEPLSEPMIHHAIHISLVVMWNVQHRWRDGGYIWADSKIKEENIRGGLLFRPGRLAIPPRANYNFARGLVFADQADYYFAQADCVARVNFHSTWANYTPFRRNKYPPGRNNLSALAK